LKLNSIIAELVEAAKTVQKDLALKPIEKKLAKRVRDIFKIHQTIFMRGFEDIGPDIFKESAKVRSVIKLIAAADAGVHNEFIDSIEEATKDSMSAAATHRAAEFGVGYSFDIGNPRATKYIHKHALNAVKDMELTTKKDIRGILEKGMKEGFGYRKVARDINKKYSEYSTPVRAGKHIRNRAELIAITEAGTAYEEGNKQVVDGMTKAGLTMEKFWSNTGDDKVSDGCQENTDVGWIPVDQNFPSGDEHSPRFPGCRCTILYRRRASDKYEKPEVIVNDTLTDEEMGNLYANRWRDISEYDYRKLALNDNEEEALLMYKGSGYTPMNHILRGKEIVKIPGRREEYEEFIKNLKHVFNHKAKTLSEPVSVYRGLGARTADKLLKAGMYTDEGFVSTSSSLQTARYFAQYSKDDYKLIMKVVLNKGQRCISMKAEDELLLSPGQKFRLVMVEKIPRIETYIYHMEVV